jgi:hypothetical protein
MSDEPTPIEGRFELGDFELQSGNVLPKAHLGFAAYGSLNEARDSAPPSGRMPGSARDGREIGERDAIRVVTGNKLCQHVSNPADETAERSFDEVLGMLEVFGGNAKRSNPLTSTTKDGFPPQQSGENNYRSRRNRYG